MSSPELLLESPRRTWETMAFIQDPSVPGLGEVTHREAYPEYVRDTFTGRWHQNYLVEYQGHKHSIMVTNPAAAMSETDIILLPGFGQTIDEKDGPGFKLHTELAARRPNERMISISSTGIGRHGDRITSPQQATMEAMAEQRHALLKAICGDRPKILLPISMGTVITNRLLQRDLHDGMSLDIKAVANVVPALVLPSEVLRRMGLEFGFHVIPDGRRELLDPRNLHNPLRIAAMLRSLLHSGLGMADLPALGTQALSMSDGTTLEALRVETDNYRVATTIASRDPLKQKPLWEEEARRHPSSVHLRELVGRGHLIVFDSVGTAVHVDRKIDHHKLAA